MFQAEGENISKLEKADILELTVRHLHRLQRPRDAVEDAQRYQAGFGQCAAEACQFLLSLPGVDTHVGHNLIKHLGACISNNGPLSIQVPNLNRLSYSPPVSPLTPAPVSVKQPPTFQHQEMLSSTPSVHDLSKPLTGLLMQVPKGETDTRSVLRNVILERRGNKGSNEDPKFQRPNVIVDGRKERLNMQVDSNVEEEEEIDIEKVEEDDENMWRPW